MYRDSSKTKPVFEAALGVLIFLGVLAAIIGLAGIKRVKYGTVGLPVVFGRLTGETWEPGMHWGFPLVVTTVELPTQVRSYETSDHPSESRADFTDFAITAQTVDGQQVDVKYTVVFRVPADGALEVARNVGDISAIVENVVKARSRNLGRTTCQLFEAETLYSGEGIVHYQERVEEQLSEVFELYGVKLDSFLVRKVDFDETYVEAIEQQQIQQEQIETERFIAAQEQHKKDARITRAEAEREELRIRAEGEADAIAIKGQALRENPEIIQLTFVEQLNNVEWGIMPSEGVTPLLPVQGR